MTCSGIVIVRNSGDKVSAQAPHACCLAAVLHPIGTKLIKATDVASYNVSMRLSSGSGRVSQDLLDELSTPLTSEEHFQILNFMKTRSVDYETAMKFMLGRVMNVDRADTLLTNYNFENISIADVLEELQTKKMYIPRDSRSEQSPHSRHRCHQAGFFIFSEPNYLDEAAP